MRILLFRHGPAGDRDPDRWPDDRLRPLTPRGETRTRRAARGILRLERPLRTILTSPLARCHRTAEILRDACALPVPPESLPALAPGGSWREVLLRLGEESPEASIALVGHEPDIGKFAGVLLFGAPASLPLKKAGACSIEFEGPVTPGGGQLRWFLPPRALASIAGARSKV
jgi:phosphohistidine phosphatase